MTQNAQNLKTGINTNDFDLPANIETSNADYDDSIPTPWLDNPKTPLCSGVGQYHTDKHGKPFDTITLNDIVRMVEHPTSVAKESAQWFIPSNLKSRSGDAQRANGQYYAVWFDFDQHTTLDAIQAVLAILLCEYWIYSSRSATEQHQKWRVIIPLSIHANATDWQHIATIINDKFQQAGIVPDRASERVNQICYLPNKGDFYQFHIEKYTPLNWRVTLSTELQAKQTQTEQEKAALKARSEQSRLKAIERMQSGCTSPIDAYKAAYSLNQCLEFYGYKRIGNKWLSPNSESGKAGVTIKGDKWISSHGSDAGIGKPCNGGCTGDSFDLFTWYEHNGNRNAAIKAAGDMFTTPNGKTINKENQIEWAKQNSVASESFNVGGDMDNKQSNASAVETPKKENQQPPRLFTPIGELVGNRVCVSWLIRDYLPLNSTCMLYGASGGGKSFMMLDMALHIACGKQWQDCKTKQGAVFYVAGEGQIGITARCYAWSLHHDIDLKNAPFYVTDGAVMPTEHEQITRFFKDIDAWIKSTGEKPSLVIFDTLARCFKGEENSAKDAGLYIDAIDGIKRRYECCVMSVHHTGKDANNGARGSSSFKGAWDAEHALSVKGGNIELSTPKLKERPPALPKAFRLESVNTGWLDDDNELVYSAVIVASDYVPSKSKLGKNDEIVLKALQDAIVFHGGESVSKKQWQDVAVKLLTQNTEQSKKDTFDRSVKNLLASNMVLLSGDSHYKSTTK